MSKSQEQQIEAALLRGETISPMDALRRYNCFRLGARIFALRKRHTIKTEHVTEDGKTFARYRLEHAGVQEALPLHEART